MKEKKLVIVGIGETAEIAYEYFSYDSEYEVVAFSVNREYMDTIEKFGLPVIPFEEVEMRYPPHKYETFVALSYVHLNRDRTNLYQKCKEKGYTCASYISSHAFVWRDVEIGENTFIFENNTIQYKVKIGNNVVLWSGNHIGHRTVLEDNVWLTSHDVVSGFCHIGKNAFLGVNATLGDNVELAEDVILGAGALTVKSLLDKGGVYVGNPARKLNRTAYEQFGVR